MNVRKNYENKKFQFFFTSTQCFSSQVEKFDENLPEVINQINQLSYKTFNDLPRGACGEHDGDGGVGGVGEHEDQPALLQDLQRSTKRWVS